MHLVFSILFLFIGVFSTQCPGLASEGFSWRQTYDDLGRVTKSVDTANRITSYTYAESGKGSLQTITVNPPEGPAISWRFDDDGSLAAMKDGQDMVVYRYDSHGNLAAVDRSGWPSIRYTYDAAGRMAELRVGDFYRIVWTYDFLGRVSALDTPAGPIRYKYQSGQGTVIRSLPNGVKTFWKRKPNGQLEAITHGFFKKPDDGNYAVLAKYEYAYRPDGRIAAISERSIQGQCMRRYAYDKMGRLTDATGPGGQTYHYAYDAVGNRTGATAQGRPGQICAYDWAGRLTHVDGMPCQYDACGNLTKVGLGGTARRYRYHADGRLAEAQVGDETVQYSYDGFGRLVVRKTDTDQLRFIPDPLSPHWQPLVIEEPGAKRTLVVWEGDTPLALIRNGSIEWQLHDHLGSVRMVTNARGKVTRTLEYDPYGVPVETSEPAAFSPGYAGLFRDRETGGLQTSARTYLPELGQFLQPDPKHAVSAGDLSKNGLYAYAFGNPVCFMDRDGRAPEWYDYGEIPSPNFSWLLDELNRSVAYQVADDRLRSRAVNGRLAAERAQKQGELHHFRFDTYNPDNMTLFVRKWNPFGSWIPHTGVHFGRDFFLDNLQMDGVELQNTRVGEREEMTVIVPMRLQSEEKGGVIRLQPLESKDVKVMVQGKSVPIADLSVAKKAEIQSNWIRLCVKEMGMTRGRFEGTGSGYSNNCVDFALSSLDKAVSASGLQFKTVKTQGQELRRGFRETYTTRIGSLAAANPSSYLGGLASKLPRREQITSGSFLNDELIRRQRESSANLLSTLGEELPGSHGDYWHAAVPFYKHLKLLYGINNSLRYAFVDHPGDPAGYAKLSGIASSVYGLLGTSGLMAPAAASASPLFSIGEMAGSAVRSRILLNRAERLVDFGNAIVPFGGEFRERMYRHSGTFSFDGPGYSSKGGYALQHSRVGLFGTTSLYNAWSRSRVSDLLTARGEHISGTFLTSERREERGGNLLNLFEPTSVTIVRTRNEQFRVSRMGGMIMPKNSMDHVDRPKSSLPSSRVDPDTDFRMGTRIGGGGPGGPGGGFGATPIHPSPVGGVYLSGSGSALNGLGMLKGVSIDTNNNLVLVGEDDAHIKLPPLRLDDMVTVFRSFYLYGEGPTVTIDPNPENPEKSAMIIRHGRGTEDTYVGWILYQADRLMKSYSQGVDNKTQAEVVSRVPAYADVLETVYFGSSEPLKAQKEGIWERYWIVPAEARRFNGPKGELTLFDVPLKVKTQKMKWEKDKLVDNPTGKSSAGALRFSSWFTNNYDAIAAERYLTPPPESGITEPVPVFLELRRIALMTAVAEKLRDQAVPMPFWMRDYETRRVPFEQFTPGLEVTRKRQEGNSVETARIFGGVQLSAESRAIKTYTTAADVARAPQDMRGEVQQKIELAESLESEIPKAIQVLAPQSLTLHRVKDGKRSYQAIPVPGAETLALGPCRLNEVDLVVPVEGGREIRLVRSFSSFFDPNGPWGRAWALDLPRLQKIRIPISRTENTAVYAPGYELLTPLNTFYARFRDIRPVPELGGSKLQVPEREGLFLGLATDRPVFLKDVETHVLILKDGQEWHFTQHGDLVAMKDGPQITVYQRRTYGELTRIITLVGGRPAGQIDLYYASDGRLTKAVGSRLDVHESRPATVIYTYNDSNRLIGVKSEDGTVGYCYDGPRISEVTWQEGASIKKPEVLRSFQYDARGRVLSEKRADETISCAVVSSQNGIVASYKEKKTDDSKTKIKETRTCYDRHMRPTEHVAADGARTQWVYPEAGGVERTVTTPDKKSLKIVDSPDARKRTIQQEGFAPITAGFNAGGRLTQLSEGDQMLLTQEWRSDGQLSHAENTIQGVSLQYGQDGLLSDITLHPARSGEVLSPWQKTKVDRKGRPVQITDYSGLNVLLGYDASGALDSAVQKTPDGNLGYNIERDSDGRIKTLKSSWGNTAYAYSKDGSLERIDETCGNQTASIEFTSGRVKTTTGFDGGRTTFQYGQKGPAAGMPREIACANGLKLDYSYSDTCNLASVTVGSNRRVRLEYDPKGRITAYTWERIKP